MTNNSLELSFLFHFYFVILSRSLSFSLSYVSPHLWWPIIHNRLDVWCTYNIFILFRGTRFILKFINALECSRFHIRLATQPLENLYVNNQLYLPLLDAFPVKWSDNSLFQIHLWLFKHHLWALCHWNINIKTNSSWTHLHSNSYNLANSNTNHYIVRLYF